MKSGRFMHVDVVENGKRMMLDRQKNVLVPEEAESMVWCKKCGAPYLSSRQKCPYCGFTREEENVEAELERAKKAVRMAKGLDEPVKLTVGDLSFARQNQRQHRVKAGLRRLDNEKRGLTVGDLSWTTESKDSPEEELQRARAEKAGLTVGDQFVGRRFTPQPTHTESQEIASEMMEKAQQKREEVSKITNIIIEQEQEKQIRKETAQARIKAEQQQVEKELDQLLRKGKAKAHMG